MSNTEQTLSIIKPDAVERNLDNEIKEMFKNKGFSIVKEKKIQIEKSEAEKFYKVHETMVELAKSGVHGKEVKKRMPKAMFRWLANNKSFTSSSGGGDE